ncbi:MAG: zinc-dependent peptidase [Thiobacillus sp.]|nr:zinc-dependent peptidase [Thiobacillus sp.]
MNWFGRWWRARILKRHLIPASAFDAAIARLPILHHLDRYERTRLRESASLFIHDKTFSAAGGADVDDATPLLVALQACLLTLNLDENSYRGWSEIILYPDAFLHQREEMDEAGVVHRSRDILAGEAWHGGPLVLSIASVEASGEADGVNVVLHEFAHKLDMLNGDANGYPPLHRGMDTAAWAHDFSTAYADLSARVDAGRDTAIDPYAVTDPAEFFAVLTEVFFETPQVINQEYPAIYQQLQLFYRQNPLGKG